MVLTTLRYLSNKDTYVRQYRGTYGGLCRLKYLSAIKIKSAGSIRIIIIIISLIRANAA